MYPKCSICGCGILAFVVAGAGVGFHLDGAFGALYGGVGAMLAVALALMAMWRVRNATRSPVRGLMKESDADFDRMRLARKARRERREGGSPKVG